MRRRVMLQYRVHTQLGCRKATAQSLAAYVHLLERNAIMPCLISTATPICLRPGLQTLQLVSHRGRPHSPTLPKTLLTAETRLL